MMPPESPADAPIHGKRLVGNTILLLAGGFSQALSGLLTGVILARYSGAVGFGQYAFVMTAVSLSGLFVESGFNTFLTRDVAQDRRRAKRYLTASLWAKLGLAAAVTVPYLLVVWSLAESRDGPIVTALLFGPILFFIIACNASFASMFRAFEAMDDVLILNVFAVAAQLAGMFLLAERGYGVAALVGWSVCVQAGRLIVSRRFFRRLLERTPEEAQGEAERASESLPRLSMTLIKRAWPFGLSTMAITLYARLDILALFFLAGEQAVGRYSAVYRFLDALRMPPGAFQGAYFPALSRAGNRRNRTEIRRSFQTARFWLLVYGAGGALITTLLARPVVIRLYTEQFAPSVPVLQVLIWTLVPLVVNDLTLTYLYAAGRERLAPRILSIGIALNLALNLGMIPRYESMGAAMATLVSDSVLFFIFWREGNRV